MASRYDAGGPQAEFEPGSRGRVLRNHVGIRRVRDMELAESEALVATQNALLDQYTLTHRFTAADVCDIHRQWLGAIYWWAGEYRSVNVSKGGFMFAAAGQVPRLMAGLEQLDFSPLAGRGKPVYFAAIQAAMGDNYKPLETLFGKAIRKTLSSFAAKP